MEDDLPAEFDFGSWCLVCGRLVSPPHSESTTAAASASSSPAHSPALSTKDGAHAKPSRKASVKRTKSSGKLHHATAGHGHGHARSKSGTRLNALAPSTQIHHSTAKGKDKAVAKATEHSTGSPPATGTAAGAETEELSSLYCSLECQRADQAGHGGAAGTAAPRVTSPLLPRPPPPQHHSSSSINSLTAQPPRHSPSPSSFSPTLSSDGLPGGLDFSTRRNSRGATYRPLAMSRTLSGGVEGGAPNAAAGVGGASLGARNRSSNSLSGMGEEHASVGGFPRPLSSLSSFRGMTPLPPSPGLKPASPTFPRPSGGRSKSDMPPPVTRFALDGDDSPRKERGRHSHEGETPEEREQRKKEKRERSRARREAGGRSSSHGPVHGRVGSSGREMAQSVPASLGLGLEELHLQNRPQLPAPIPQRPPNRSSSSASLALMGSSFSSKSYDARMHTSRLLQPQATLGRSESTASLSGLTAQGTILPPSAGGAGDASSPSTFIPPLPRPPLYSPTHPRSSLSIPTAFASQAGAESSSPSSAASTSFTNSHHSASQSGTSHSSHYLSSSAGSHTHSSASGRERGRTTRGLAMTASSASLASKGGESGRSHSRADKSRTPKASAVGHIQPPPPDRAASTPAAARRPSIYQTAPTPSPRRPSSSHSHTSTSPNAQRPSALQTPSLSYLAAEGTTGGETAAPKRNFSWNQLGVKAYHSLDLDEVRAAGAADGKGTVRPVGARKSKAKLFHFAMDDDEM